MSPKLSRSTVPSVTVFSINVLDLLAAAEGDSDPNLVTRQTGRAVRALIEAELARRPPGSVCMIDFRGVGVLDYSCADEVAARVRATASSVVVFRCTQDRHADQLGTVLEHHSLAAVAETGPGRFQLLGRVEAHTRSAWQALEEAGIGSNSDGLPTEPPAGYGALAADGLAFRCERSGAYHAFSSILSK